MQSTLKSIAIVAVLFSASATQAGTVTWADWTSSGSQAVYGNIGSIGVTAAGTGDQSFAQLNNSGINYWTGPATTYINSPPATTDIIGLNDKGTETIRFSKAVTNPLIALVSWNGATVTTSDPIQTLSSGLGYWGSGSFANVTGNSFYGSGELHGVYEFLGTYTSVSFYDATPENWHGYTVGIQTPVPAALFFVAPALAGVFGFSRRKAA